VADVAERFEQASAACRAVRSLSAEIALSGRARGGRVRGRVFAGTDASGRARLEAVAPFGAPVFVLAARDGEATVILPRDHQVVRHAPVEDVLDALAGLPLTAEDLHAVLAGCAAAPARPTGGRSYGAGWLAVDLSGGATVWLRDRQGQPTVVAGERGGLVVEYGEVVPPLPRRVRLFRAGGPGGTPMDLVLRLSQVEVNAVLPAAAFEVSVPPGTGEMSLDELRRYGVLAR
jgi:hypothetical protein